MRYFGVFNMVSRLVVQRYEKSSAKPNGIRGCREGVSKMGPKIAVIECLGVFRIRNYLVVMCLLLCISMLSLN